MTNHTTPPTPMQIEHVDDVAILRMDGPRGNAISPASVKAFAQALYAVEQGSARALVLTGNGRVFCGGLDLVGGDAMPRHEFATFVDAFEAMFLQLFAFRLPVVAAIDGPALAGGAVLAAACDARVSSSSERARFGFIETTLALPLPSAALEIAKFAAPTTQWTDAIVKGMRFAPAEALRRGLVDEVVDGDVVAAATTHARTFVACGAFAVSKTKADLRHDALTRARARALESRRIFVEQWFSEDGTARRKALVASLARKD